MKIKYPKVSIDKLIEVIPTLMLKSIILKCNITLKTICSDNVNKLVFAHLNINSIRNKFEFLAMQIKSKIDILMTSATKIDQSFPKKKFLIEGYIGYVMILNVR